MTAKMISKKYLKYTRQDWQDIRYKIMRWCLEVKLSQNWDKFSKVLLDTGSKAIVEVSNKDKVWAAIPEGDKLVGINALGRLLMDIREKCVKDNNYHRCVSTLPITGFMLFGNLIEEVCNETFVEELEYR